MLIIRVLVSRATNSVSIQDPDRNIRWSVKLLTETDVQGQLVRERAERWREGRVLRKGQDLCYQMKNGNLQDKLTCARTHTHTHTHTQTQRS